MMMGDGCIWKGCGGGGGQRGILLRQRHVAISRLRYLVTRWRCGDDVMCAVVRCEVMRVCGGEVEVW